MTVTFESIDTSHWQAAFAPICWSTKPGADEYAGAWRHAGTGMMCFYVSDLDVLKPPGRIPLAEKMSWGDEDYALLKVTCTCELRLRFKLHAAFRVHTACMPVEQCQH